MNRKSPIRLTLSEQVMVHSWIRENVPQHRIDNARLSYADLADLVRKEVGVKLTGRMIRRFIMSLGLRAAEENLEAMKPAHQASHARAKTTKSPEDADLTALTTAIQDLTTGVKMLVQLMERKLVLEEATQICPEAGRSSTGPEIH